MRASQRSAVRPANSIIYRHIIQRRPRQRLFTTQRRVLRNRRLHHLLLRRHHLYSRTTALRQPISGGLPIKITTDDNEKAQKQRGSFTQPSRLLDVLILTVVTEGM